MLVIGFTGITLVVIVLFYLGTGKNSQLLAAITGWLIVTGILSRSGFFLNVTAMPPHMLLVLLPVIAGVVYCYRNIAAERVHLNILLGMHIMRIPVEWALYALFLQGKLPVTMTFRGWNWDIVTGITAALLLLYNLVSRKEISPVLLRCWNWLGILLLANVVTIGILSAPSPFQQLAFDRPNVAILQFPFTFLPAIVVPLVLLSHLLALKKLKTGPKNRW